jgi:AhpD family alkylhydroperoxidase
MKAPGYQMSLPLVAIKDANPETAEALRAAKKRIGFIPNLYGKMANSPPVLMTFLEGYRRFREQTDLSPVEQEVILLTISWENACTYAMAAHSAIADRSTGMPKELIEAIRFGGIIEDPKLAALHDMTRIMLRSRGRPAPAKVEPFLEAGYDERHLLEIVLAISITTLSNYSSHLLAPELDDGYADYAWQPV